MTTFPVSPKTIFMRSKFQLAVLFGISALFFTACSESAGKDKPVDMEKEIGRAHV